MKQPVILQVLPALNVGGVERGTIEMTRALTERGWKALVASSGGSLVPSVGYSGGMHHTLPLSSKNPLVMAQNIRALEKLMLEYQVDLVHARSRAPAWSAHFAAKKIGIPFVTTFHGIYRKQNKWKHKYNSIMTCGDRVIAVSNFVAAHIQSNYECDSQKLRVIHRGVDTNAFHPSRVHPARMGELANSWAIPEHLPVILFPGRITRWKGQDVFIEALSTLPHRDFLALFLGGDDGHEEYRQELEELVVKRNLEGHVRFVGTTNNMPEAYTLSRFVVATSTEPEAFGRVVLEAQSMGRPVIATRHGGACETVIHGVSGWLVEPGNVKELAAQIDHALHLDDETYALIGEAGMRNANEFTTQRMCQRVMSVYEELVGG